MNRRAWAIGAAMVLFGNLVAVALRSYAEAAFLDAYGARLLPWLLIASAGGLAAATLGYDAISRRFDSRTVDLGLLVVLGVAAVTAPSLLDAGTPPVVLVVALAAVSQVAGLALWNRVCASVAGRDARRYLPRAGAAVTAGGAIAGLGAGALVYRLGMHVLPYLGAAVTVVVGVLAIAQDRALATGGAPGAAAPAGTPEGLNDGHRRLVRAMIAVAALEAIVGTVIDLQFVAQLKGRYRGDALAVAVSLFYGGTNLILLALQATAVPRLLVTRSLPTTAAIHPALVIAGYVGFAAVPGFGAIASTRTSDQVLRFATSRTAQEVSLSAVPPGPRARWKVLLRGAIGPAGAGFAALGLLALGPAALAHPARLAAIAIGVAIAWFVAGQIAARRFQAALAAPLGIRARRIDDPRRIDLATLEAWTHAAGDDDPRIAGLARAALARARVDATDLAEHLRHDAPAVRAALFDQLARAPSPALRGELRAAVMIEDDDRALALGLKALALAGDDGALERGRSRAALSREVAAVVQSAERTLRGGELASELAILCERDPGWASALIRARRGELADDVLADLLRAAAAIPARRAGAMSVIARVGPLGALPVFAAALEAGAPEALAALAALDEPGARLLAGELDAFGPLARLAIARGLAGAPAGTSLVAALLDDPDPEIALATLRTALAVARGGGELPAAPIAAAHGAALTALIAHLDARDAAAAWTACARRELELATRSCVARLLCAAAVEAAAAGRDPAALAATARRLIAGHEPDRRRALDVVQELQTGRAEILAVLERWLRPAAATGRPYDLAACDPWLARLAAGELAAVEPTLDALRAARLFSTVAGPALAALAARTTTRTCDGVLFAEATAGDCMFVVVAGALRTSRAGAAVGPRWPDPEAAPERPPARSARPDPEAAPEQPSGARITPGGVVGELAVLTSAPRAATVVGDPTATVIEIDRETFAAASRRAPELVLGLSATLAGWLAPRRPDVL